MKGGPGELAHFLLVINPLDTCFARLNFISGFLKRSIMFLNSDNDVFEIN